MFDPFGHPYFIRGPSASYMLAVSQSFIMIIIIIRPFCTYWDIVARHYYTIIIRSSYLRVAVKTSFLLSPLNFFPNIPPHGFFLSVSFSFKPPYFLSQYLPLSMFPFSMFSLLNVSPSQCFPFSIFPFLNVFPSQCFCLSMSLPLDVLGFFMERIILDIIQCMNAVATATGVGRGDICNYHDTNKIWRPRFSSDVHIRTLNSLIIRQ